MVAIAYHVSRGIGLTFSLSLMLASICQLCYYLYLKTHHKKLDFKFYIHLGCLFNGFCIMLGFIDSYGAFKLVAFDATRILTNTIGIRGLIISLCIIIYGHFSAHYLAAKKTIPPFFERALILSFVVTTIPSIIGSILCTWNPALFRIEVAFQTAWTASIAIIDAYGYYLVRELIIDLKKSQPPHSPTHTNGAAATSHNNGHHHEGSGSNADDLLARIRRYHILFLTMMTGYVLYGIYSLATRSSVGFVPPNPDKFSMGVSTSWMPYTYLILQTILTGWAWTPFTTMQEVYLSTSGGKMVSSTELHRKMTSTTPTTVTITPSTKDQMELKNISSTELVRSPSEEQNLLKTPTEQNMDNSVQETVYYEQQSPVVGSEDLSGSVRSGGTEDISVSGRPFNDGADGVVHVTISENGQIVLPQRI